MAVIETWLRQDLKGLVTVRSLQGQVFSLDNGGNLIGVKVTKDGQPVTLTGTVTGYCILSDGQTVTVTGSGKSGIQNGNEAYIVLPQLVYSVPGQISIVIKLTSGSVTTTLAACTGYVYRSRTSNEVVPPGTPIPDLATLEEAISRANAATDSANTAASSANNAATAAENVNVAMSKSGKVITITATNRSGASTSHTVTEPTLTVQRANDVVTVTATDADGQTSIEFDAVDADEVAELQEAVSTKAEEDGYYEELTAGSAEQLISTEAVTDTTPYLYRKSGGSVDIGNRETLEKIVGGTVNWNQIFENWTSFISQGGASFTYADGIGTAELPDNHAQIARGIITGGTLPEYSNATHKYLTVCDLKLHDAAQKVMFFGGSQGIIREVTGTTNWVHVEALFTNPYGFWLLRGASTGAATVDVKNIMLINLTMMFGPTIADYVYNLEQATPGAGVAWFRKLFPKDYYPYNPGELISVKPSSHDMVGFNLWDEEWEVGYINSTTGAQQNASDAIRSKNYIPAIGGETYHISTAYTAANQRPYLHWYDADKKWIGCGYSSSGQNNYTVTIPNNAKYLKFTVANISTPVTYNHDICINLSGSRNGEYEPYEKHSYPLADVELRGPLAIDENGKLVYSGDEYTPDGLVKRKYGIATITADQINGATLDGVNRRVPCSNTALRTLADYKPGMAVGPYTYRTSWADVSNNDKSFAINAGTSGVMVVHDSSINSADDLRAVLERMPITVITELATPTIEQAAPYTPIQVVDDWGTEEFVDTREVAVPVGHFTSYMANLRDKLQHLPSLADDDGEYIVKQTGTKMELAKLSNSGLAQSIYETVESTPVANFADGADGQAMKAVNVAIEPVQDLHGYDAPWPAGGGKNVLDPNIKFTAGTYYGLTLSTTDGYRYTLTGTATGSGNVLTSAVASQDAVILPAGTYYSKVGTLSLYKADGTWLRNQYSGVVFTVDEPFFVKNIYIEIVSGRTYNYNEFFAIEKGQTAPTEWTPYSNVCPISGWTGAKVTRCGKNLLPMPIQSGSYANTMSVTVNEDKSFYVTKTNASGWTNLALASGMTLKAGTYTIIEDDDSSGNCALNVYYAGTQTAVTHTRYTKCMRFTLEKDTNVDINYSRSAIADNVLTKVMLFMGNTATAADYEPYKGQTYEVTFPTEAGTVYGGTLDAASGKLVVDRAKIVLDGTEPWGWDSNNQLAQTVANGGVITNGVTQHNVYTQNSTFTDRSWALRLSVDGTLGMYYGVSRIYAKYSKITDAESAKAFFASNPTTVVYKLAQSVEIDLTPTEIKTLLGTNNIWADAGNVAITYPADTKLYIDNKIAELQALILENNG